MKRNWDDDREIENLAMANCLMLLNRVGGRSDSDRIFHCKTCNKQFSSFQALGGHRTSHKRLKTADESPPVKAKTHECSICGLEFELGQALGGHMRKHRDSLQAVKIVPAKVEVSVVEEVADGGRRGLCLDLNLTPFQNEMKSWSRNGRTAGIVI